MNNERKVKILKRDERPRPTRVDDMRQKLKDRRRDLIRQVREIERELQTV